jgi:hypothetical protein
MLTEIEWWGGLMIIWIVLVNYMLIKAGDWDTTLETTVATITFITSMIVIVLYFYPLETETIQYLYVGSIGLGTVTGIIWFLLSANEPSEKKETASTEEEDAGKGLEIAANVILFAPPLMVFGLGIYKASEFSEILPFLS